MPERIIVLFRSDDDDVIQCRYSVAESTEVLDAVGTGSEYIPV
jgi:hypothetical protein